jgi:hypothetical protein
VRFNIIRFVVDIAEVARSTYLLTNNKLIRRLLLLWSRMLRLELQGLELKHWEQKDHPLDRQQREQHWRLQQRQKQQEQEQ